LFHLAGEENGLISWYQLYPVCTEILQREMMNGDGEDSETLKHVQIICTQLQSHRCQ